jgi:hypothetical protein
LLPQTLLSLQLLPQPLQLLPHLPLLELLPQTLQQLQRLLCPDWLGHMRSVGREDLMLLR